MSLTLGSGPLGREPGAANFTVESPAHRLLFEPDPRRLRALVGDRVVLDTTRAHLLHETGILPVVYAPLEDFDAGVLERTATTTHCPFKGDATYFSIRAGDRLVEDAAWTYEQPLERAPWLKGFAALYPDRVDAWFVEDEPLTGHLRDPYHRVDVHASSRPVRVTAGEQVIAQSTRPVLVFETSLPARPYIPLADVPAGVLTPSATHTHCPYKGEATYYDVHAGGTTYPDAAFGYDAPLPESLKLAGHVSFWGEHVRVDLLDA
jgi:uncharacterized protein (DUF427 family)